MISSRLVAGETTAHRGERTAPYRSSCGLVEGWCLANASGRRRAGLRSGRRACVWRDTGAPRGRGSDETAAGLECRLRRRGTVRVAGAVNDDDCRVLVDASGSIGLDDVGFWMARDSYKSSAARARRFRSPRQSRSHLRLGIVTTRGRRISSARHCPLTNEPTAGSDGAVDSDRSRTRASGKSLPTRALIAS